MPTTLDRLAAAEMVRKALDEGTDVRTLSAEDYRLVRSAMIARSEQAQRQQTGADALTAAIAKRTKRI